jgi:plastocyanin
MRRAAVLLVLAVPAPATAAHPGHGPEQVRVGGFSFGPAEARVGTGDTVLWIWTGPDFRHTVTSDPGQAESFDSDPGGTQDRPPNGYFAHRFTRPGRYTYVCRRHPDLMRGAIEVVELPAASDGTAPRLTRVRVKRKRVAFTVDERATVLGRLERRVRGRWRPRRSFDVTARRGRNRARLPLSGLTRGRYRVRLTAYDAADNRSRPAFARVRALHPRST